MNRTYILMAGSLVALIGIVLLLGDRDKPSTSGRAVMLYCAASNRAVMESIREEYEQEFDRSVDIQYGPSQTLLSSIEVAKQGDLYLPADDSYLKLGKEKGLVAEEIPIAKMQAVIAVPKGNPKSIQSLDDLLREDVRVVLASPDSAAIGKVVRESLSEVGRWDSLDKATKAYRGTVNE
uniref:substrate-binding domain-containing protein n=1 Tax=Stieleria sp. TaxID=2795976 RepID=UPI0035622407